MSTAPDEDARTAFKTILDDAHIENVTVYKRRPDPAFDVRSVVMSLVSGVTSKPSIGLFVGGGNTAFEERLRLQIDCFFDDPDAVGVLANQVIQEILDNRDLLEATYGIFNLGIAGNREVPQADLSTRVWQQSIDVIFSMNRAVS